MEKYTKMLDDLKENMYLDGDGSGKIVRVRNPIFLFGETYPLMREDVLWRNYQDKIKEVLKNLRGYPEGKLTGWREVNLAPLFSPVFNEYDFNFEKRYKEDVENPSPLKLSNWKESHQQSGNYKINFEVPLAYWTGFQGEDLIEFAKGIDEKIIEALDLKQNSLVGKLKRKSIKNIEFPEIEYSFEDKDPILETFCNRAPDMVCGIEFDDGLWGLD